jgi:hypothetical protein
MNTLFPLKFQDNAHFAPEDKRQTELRFIFKAVSLFVIVLFLPLAVHSQQPFVTDDADVTPRGKFHFEFSNSFDFLQRSAAPALRQNTASFELAYGLLENVEISVEAPLITIFSSRDAEQRRITGIGDTNLSVKYNFLREREGSRWPALTISGNFEIPTGDTERGLGSGIADYSINGIAQKTLNERTTLRVNTGIIFSGNTATGALGTRGVRGFVFTGGTSLVRRFNERLQLGMEVTGAASRTTDLGSGGLQFQAGGNYTMRENLTFDFGFVAGRFPASPRAGFQIGFSYDF